MFINVSIDEISVLINVGKSGLGLLIFFRERNICVHKLANLGFIHKELFH